MNTRITNKPHIGITVFVLAILPATCLAESKPSLHLESTIVGDKEQPSVSYFVPWQGVGRPDKLYWNIEPKFDESLNVADRKVIMRSHIIYQELALENP